MITVKPRRCDQAADFSSRLISNQGVANWRKKRRVATVALCFLTSLVSLIAALAAHERGLRLAANPTAIATVIDIPIGRSGTSGEYAHLTFDRRD